jgi:predicted unusual protein kinase regulating ubiquinone biosynthesis (AarF/ABC1/UbiB family)
VFVFVKRRAVKKLKTSIFSRSSQLIGVASRIAGHEMTQKIKGSLAKSIEDHAPEVVKTRMAQAKILAENLSQLKGAAMKVGQLLSIDSSDLLPPEATEILSQLQSFSEPVDFSQVEKVLKEDFTQEQLQLLNINKKALAAASIGQVHRGNFKGQELAIKIQYPGVRESIGSDLALLKKIVGAFIKMSSRSIELDGLFTELRDILIQETDYLRELDLLSAYGRKLSEAGLSANYAVPKVFPQFSTSRVLTMSYEQGVPLKDWITAGPSREAKDHMARLILDLYCREFFDWGLVQTDPNFGNFLVREDNQLVLLDFGATLTYDKTFIETYRNLLRAMSSFDDGKIIQASIDFNLIDPRESKETKDNYIEFMKTALEPFLPHKQPFQFSDPDYTRRSIAVGRKFTGSLKFSAPPKHILFLHRKLGGIFNLMRRMEVRMVLTPYWEKMIQSKLPGSTVD